MKILYFDVETTGLDPSKDFITQLSGLIEIDGEVKDEFNFFLRPPKGTPVSKKALEVTGKTIEDLRDYPDAEESFYDFVSLLNKYMFDYSWSDRFYPAGYNGYFDLQFVDQMFKRQFNSNEWGKYQKWQLIDPLPVLRALSTFGQIEFYNHKLSTVCKHFDIDIDAHDAMSDIYATRRLVQILKNGLKLSGPSKDTSEKRSKKQIKEPKYI